MLLFENNDQVSPLYHRAIRLTISKEFAEQSTNKIKTVKQQNTEQQNTRRELLEVEEQAKQERLIREHGISHFKNQVTQKFFSQLNTQINNEFDNKEKLYSELLHIEDAAPKILEILAVKAASINRIAPLVDKLPWLSNELLALVNKPQYRKKSAVQVTEPQLALSYVGLDNLKLVMPTFMLKHWLPESTTPYPLMKRKLWNNSLSIALAAKALAKKAELCQFTAFATGMFSNIGLLTVSRSFLQHYNEMLKEELKEAYNNRDKRLHEILSQIEMQPAQLLSQLTEHSTQISAEIVELMRFDRLAITEPLFDLAILESFERMHPIAQIVTKAKAYVAYRSLAKEDLINNDEAKLLLGAAKLTSNDITLLKRADIDHLKLNFE